MKGIREICDPPVNSHRIFCINLSIPFFLIICVLFSCKDKEIPNRQMVSLLKEVYDIENDPRNSFYPLATIRISDSVLQSSSPEEMVVYSAMYNKAHALLQLGEEKQAIEIFEKLLSDLSPMDFDRRNEVMKDLAVSYMRLGERTNCIHNHTAESCIFPISVAGRHEDKTGSEKAIELYKRILAEDLSDLESKWLMNIAYMTIGAYPEQVPPGLLLKVMDDDTSGTIKPFKDVAAHVGLNLKDMGGGSIIDDFNNDGYLDIVLSSWDLGEPMHYCRNNGNGTFTDVSDSSGLGYLTGGLNMMQTDYNNDGWKDIFVLRGAWKRKFGKAPNSLLRNNGDGTFTDVTKESGLLSFHPTQTATWNDFNNDGWLDVFIGNESTAEAGPQPCELYINNKNGTFTEKSVSAECAFTEFVKGVTSGDYDNDGFADVFISTLNGRKILLKNISAGNGPVKFTDVSQQAGVSSNQTQTFPAWFWDYDNDGWLDILVCGYEFYKSLAYYSGAEATGAPVGSSGKVFLFRNKKDGTFEEVSLVSGLTKVAFAMGANFGDIDNDGYLDFYLGTGNPNFKSLIPNKLFKNMNGQRFLDVTTSARVGNLQKGHGISFADMDNDGNEDIYIEMGGAYKGDAYENSFYLNPGQNNNHWINISVEGVTSNKAAIGAKIKVTFTENGKTRSVYRDVNSGGSFGSNPLRQHIGIGSAAVIDNVEIKWPVTGKVQVFKNVPVDRNIKIKENENSFTTYQLAKVDFNKIRSGLISCEPGKK